MVTNFEHIKRWKKMYDSAVEMEDSLLAATTELKYKKAIGASRDVIEHMTKEMVKTAGLSDQQVLDAMAEDGKGGRYPTNYGRILAIKKLGLLSPESLNNIFFLNKNGNAGNHTDSELDNMGMDQIKRLAEEVYEKLYRETYLFSHQYMPILEARKELGIKKGGNGIGDSSAAWGVGIFIFIIIVIFIICASSM